MCRISGNTLNYLANFFKELVLPMTVKFIDFNWQRKTRGELPNAAVAS